MHTRLYNRTAPHGSWHTKFMAIKPFIALNVTAERVGDGPLPWAWSIFNESAKMLTARSRPEYAERGQALGAGHAVAAAVRRKLELAHTREMTKTQAVLGSRRRMV